MDSGEEQWEHCLQSREPGGRGGRALLLNSVGSCGQGGDKDYSHRPNQLFFVSLTLIHQFSRGEETKGVRKAWLLYSVLSATAICYSLAPWQLTVISSKAVDDVHVLPESVLVVLGAEYWPHLCPALPNVWDVILTEEEMVGGHLTGYRQTILLSNTDYSHLGGKGIQ